MMMRTAVVSASAAFLLLSLPAISQEMPPDPRAAALSADFAYEHQFVEVTADGVTATMAYVDEGSGDPILFLHGNPTSSYLWRNVMPFVEGSGRLLAPDLVGFGQSDKPDIGYTFPEHAAFLDAFIAALDLQDITLVVHDWGSGLGFYYAARHPENVKAIAFMEALAPPVFPMQSYADMGPFEPIFRAMRDPEQGPEMVINQNFFIEELMPQAVLRPLGEAEMNAYRAPFLEVESRLPVLVWPNEIPIEGHPARMVDVMQDIGGWLTTSETPKLVMYANPGALLPPPVAAWMVENFPNTEAQFIGYGLHYVQEDNPEAIGRGIAEWLRRLDAEM